MTADIARHHATNGESAMTAHPVTWFTGGGPSRPTDSGTVFVKPTPPVFPCDWCGWMAWNCTCRRRYDRVAIRARHEASLLRAARSSTAGWRRAA
jgi:hypothetical protein